MTLTAAIMGFTNSLLSVVTQFGFTLTETQHAAIVGLVNAALVLVFAVMHVQQRQNGNGKAA